MIARIAAAVALGSAALFASFNCFAADLSHEYDKCLQSTSTNGDWLVCGEAEMDRQDKRLSDAWDKVVACFGTDPLYRDSKQKLIEDQRLWTKWKDTSCDFYMGHDPDGAPTYGREGEVLSFPACRATVLAQRAEFIEQLEKDMCDK